MKITVIGAGAMGSLIGGYLSRANEVTLIDTTQDKVDAINAHGLVIQETDGSETHVAPRAAVSSEGLAQQDLVILFVKSLFSRAALDANRALFGPDTH